MNKFRWTLLITTFSTLAMANGEELYKNCAGCHGDNGQKKALQQSAPIGGQASDTTIKQLTAYKNGELNQYGLGNIMKMQLLTLTEENIRDLANYIAKLKP
ncbi:c-type cytochrome [bacterium]|nr:c-type cytochrome [bacterium]MBU1959308.1 c-type cytochrome [bacterium]